MSTTIDSLNFDFTASNVNIDGKVDAIVEMMGKIADSIGKISPAKLNKITTGIGNLATGIQSLSNVDTGKLSSVVDNIDRLSNVRGFTNLRKAMTDTAKTANDLGKTKVNTDFFAKSNAEKTISQIDKAYTSALEKFKDIGKDWKFDGSIESAKQLQSELYTLRNRLVSVFESNVRNGGVFDKSLISNFARNITEANNRLQTLYAYIRNAEKSAREISDTKINAPFQQAAEKAQEAAKSAQSFLSMISGAFKSNVDNGKDWISPESINERRRAFVEMRLQMEAIASELSRMSGQGNTADANKVQVLANAYQTLRNQISKIELPEGSLDDLDTRLRSILARTQENPLLNGKLNPNIDWSTLNVGEEKVKSIGKAAEDAALKFNAISKFEMPQLSIGTRFTNEAKELIQNINKAEESIARLKDRVSKMQALDKMGSFGAKSLHFDYDKEVRRYNQMIDKFRELQAEGKVFEKIRNAMEGLNFEPVALRDGEKYTRGYANLVSHIESARKSLEKLSEVQEQMVRFGADYGKAWEKNQYNIDRTRAKMAEYVAQAHNMESAGEATAESGSAVSSLLSLRSGASKISGVFDKLLASMKKLLATTISLGAKGVKAFTQMTVAITSGTIKAVMRLGSAVGSVINRMAELSGITKLFSNTNIFGKIQKAIKKIATLTVFMFLRTTIRNLMNSVREGLDNIVQVSEKANAALSSFATNVTYLKNSFAAMVTPILYAVYPAIEKLANMVAHAANIMAAFFAAITGQSTYTRAIRVQEDYAASLNKTSTAASKLHKQLAGFDDLNNLTTSQGSDTVLPSVQDMFEEVQVPDNIKNLADKIKDILKTDDWSELGEMLADKLNNAMRNIPWDKIEAEAQRIAKGIGTLINGFVDRLDWDLLGRTIAKGINTALHFANTLLETIDFHKIGESLGKALNGLIDELDFDALGRFFANKFNWLIDIVHGFLQEMVDEWYHFGSRVGEAVDSFFRNIHLQEALENIALGLNGIADFVNGFVENWIDESYEWGKKIGDAVANMFSMIEWENIGRAFDNGLKLIITICEGFLDRMEGEWANIGEGISNMIEAAFDPETFARMGTVIARSINGIIEVFQNMFKNMSMWENIGLSLGNFVNNIVNGINWSAAVDTVVNFVNGFFLALERFNSQVEWKKLADTLSAAINSLIYGIDWDSASKAFGQLLLNLFNTVHDIVKQVDWGAVGKAIGTMLGNIPWGEILKDVFDIIWTVLSGLIKGLLSTKGGRVAVLTLALLTAFKIWLTKILPAGLLFIFSSLTGQMGTGFSMLGASATASSTAVFSSLGASITGLATSLFTKLGALFSSLGSGIVAALTNPYVLAGVIIAGLLVAFFANWDKISDFLERLRSKWRNFKKETLNPALEKAGEKVKEFGENLKDKIGGGLEKAGEKLKEFGGNLKDKITDGFDKAKEKLKGFGENLKEKITDGFENAKEKVKTFGENLKNKVSDGLENAKEKIKTFGGNLKEKITDGFGNAKDKLSEFGENLKNKFSSGLGNANDKAKEFGGTLKDKITEGAEKAGGKLKEFADKVKSIFGSSDEQNEDWLDPFGNQKPVKGSIIDVWKGLEDKAKEHFGGIEGIISAAWNGIQTATNTAWETVRSGVTTAWDGIKSALTTAWGGISGAAETAFSGIKGVIDGAWNGIKTGAETAWNGISTSIQGVWNGLLQGATSIFGAVRDTVNGVWQNMQTTASTIWGAISTSLSVVWNGITTLAGTVFNGISTTVSGAWTAIQNTTSSVWGAIQGVLSGVWNTISSGAQVLFSGISNIASSTFDAVQGVAQNIFNTLSNAANSAVSLAQSLVGNIANGLREGISNVTHAVGSIVDTIMGALSSAATNAFEKGKEIVGNIANGLGNAVSTVVSSAQNVASNIGTSLGKAVEYAGTTARNIGTTITTGLSNAGKWGSDMAGNLANGIQSGIGWVTNSVSSLAGTIKGWLGHSVPQEGVLTDELTWMPHMMENLSNGIEDSLWRIRDRMKDITAEISKGLGNIQVSNYGSDIPSSISSGISSKKRTAYDAAHNLRENISSAFDNMGDIGSYASYNIITSFSEHVERNMDRARAAVSKLAETVKDRMYDALGIHSPSRVFAEIGKRLVEGFNKGIESLAGTTDRIIDGWVESLTDIKSNVNVKANITGIDKLSPNLGSEIDLQRSMAMQNNVTLDGSEIKNLVHAIEMMTMQDQAAMRTQTEYLQQIARKEFTIGQRDVFSAVQNEATAYEMRTGQPAFGY